jgi:predicted amidohydrolase
MRIAIYQCEGRSARTQDNLEILRQSALAAAAQGARLLICPEMFLTGYNIGNKVFELAETVEGPSTQKAAQIAREANIALLYGYPERSETVVFNSAMLIDHNGNRLANYRKTHLYGQEETRLFHPGDYLIIAELEGLKVGLLICYDIEFPEAVRALARAGAEFIAVPTALMEPHCWISQMIVPTRAVENQVFVAYVNRCGHEDDLNYCGSSCIVGPDGIDRVRTGSAERLCVVDINPADLRASREKFPYLSDLRSALYLNPVRKAAGVSDEPSSDEGQPN